MNEEQNDSTLQAGVSKLLRPALIISEHTIREYSAFLQHLLVGLADESIFAALVCPERCDVDAVVSPSVEVIRYPSFELLMLLCRNGETIVEKLERFKPSILHCLCESKAGFTRRLSEQLDLPYVLMINSLQKRWRPFSASLGNCAKIIVPAESIAANLTEVYPKLSGRVERINIGTFAGERIVCFGEPGRVASMVTAAKLKERSELEQLIGAVRHLAIDGYEFMLVIMGDGPAEWRLRKMLGGAGLSQFVTIVPRLEPRRSVLAAGDVFIRAAASDAFDPLLLEAMSVGTAIAACKGGVDDLIIEGETAVVFDQYDEVNIYTTLRQLLDSHELARQRAEGAQKYLRENNTVSRMISVILQIYQQVQSGEPVKLEASET